MPYSGTKEEIALKQKVHDVKYYQDNKKKIKAKRAEYYKSNREKVKVLSAKWEKANSEKAKTRKANYYKVNSEKIKSNMAKYCKENPEKAKRKNVKTNFKRKYNITVEVYEIMYSSQLGKCGICGGQKKSSLEIGFKQRDVLCVDHCHASKKVRSLLCYKCNLILGFANDNPLILRNAADYVEYHKNLKLDKII